MKFILNPFMVSGGSSEFKAIKRPLSLTGPWNPKRRFRTGRSLEYPKIPPANLEGQGYSGYPGNGIHVLLCLDMKRPLEVLGRAGRVLEIPSKGIDREQSCPKNHVRKTGSASGCRKYHQSLAGPFMVYWKSNQRKINGNFTGRKCYRAKSDRTRGMKDRKGMKTEV